MRYKNNPAWSLNGSSYTIPDELSHWEKFLEAEQIAEQDFGSNPKVLDFLVKNARHYFVPTKVLKLYGMDLEDI